MRLMITVAVLLTLLPGSVFGQYYSDIFKLQAKESEISTRPFSMVIDKDSEISLDFLGEIYGFAITGNAKMFDDEESFIRIILMDDYGYEYLVYQCFPALTDRNDISFVGTAIETAHLDGITPKSLKVEVKNAQVVINKLHFVEQNEYEKENTKNAYELQKRQNKHIVDMLNQTLERRGMTWRAKQTSMSMMTYEEKKDMFGGENPMMYGFEYYGGGIFVMPGASRRMKPTESSSEPYVSEWDWRNRHGRNWMTPVKYQGDCGSCWAFSSIGTFESYINLYFNQLINLDLSEQEILSCANAGNCRRGWLFLALSYIKSNGVVPEACFNYTAQKDTCVNKCDDPGDILSIDNYISAYTTVEDSIKRMLFKSPICFGILPWRHFVVLSGFKEIHAGDYCFTSNNSSYTVPIPASSPFVGHPAWLIKNSLGESWGDNGFGYVAMSLSDAYSIFKLSGRVSSLVYSDSDIVCEDRDGDGYYFWGIGSKPTNCPSWVPDEPDGDDSDINWGPINEYGYLQQLSCGTTINTSLVFTGNQAISCNLGIVNGGSLTINGIATITDDANIRVCEGGTLIVDGGTIQDANLTLVPGCALILRNGGIIRMASGKTFEAPVGAIVSVESGEIN